MKVIFQRREHLAPALLLLLYSPPTLQIVFWLSLPVCHSYSALWWRAWKSVQARCPSPTLKLSPLLHTHTFCLLFLSVDSVPGSHFICPQTQPNFFCLNFNFSFIFCVMVTRTRLKVLQPPRELFRINYSKNSSTIYPLAFLILPPVQTTSSMVASPSYGLDRSYLFEVITWTYQLWPPISSTNNPLSHK